MISVLSIGAALYAISTYARAHNALKNLGFDNDTENYLFFTGKTSRLFKML